MLMVVVLAPISMSIYQHSINQENEGIANKHQQERERK